MGFNDIGGEEVRPCIRGLQAGEPAACIGFKAPREVAILRGEAIKADRTDASLAGKDERERGSAIYTQEMP